MTYVPGTAWRVWAMCVLLVLGLAACGDDTEDGLHAEDGGADDGAVDERADAAAGDGGDRRDASDPDASDPDASDPDAGPGSDLTPAGLCEQLRALAETSICDNMLDGACGDRLDESSRRCALVVSAVEQGRLRFDANAAEACLEGLGAQAAAEAFASRYLPCTAVFIGRVAQGEDCYFDYGFVDNECGPATYCESGAACPGTCQPYRTVGESCPSAGPCAPELACERTCELPCDGACQPRPTEGENCQITAGACARGLICDATTEPHSCMRPRALGEACTRSYQCATFTCVDEECVRPPTGECIADRDCDEDEHCDVSVSLGTCEPDLQEGEVCSEPSQCATGLDCTYHHQGGDSTCRASAGGVGDPCLPWGCDPGLYCSDGDDTPVCEAPRGMGETCEEPSNVLSFISPTCEPGLHCMLSSTLTCLPPSGMGGPCYYNDVESCEAGLVCLGYALSTCVLPRELGETCNPAFENACSEGYCRCEMIEDSCDWSCEAQLEDGEPCDDPAACASGHCDYDATPSVCAQAPSEPPPLCLPG